jgi:hypothetical protein
MREGERELRTSDSRRIMHHQKLKILDAAHPTVVTVVHAGSAVTATHRWEVTGQPSYNTTAFDWRAVGCQRCLLPTW